ncbi:hypothetical protein PINS_up020925 [Pythium insidiosum]|nr:hypothetical protein PINS_up013045 [Pythium insidiosum]GLE09316.1 hypothetical protein PINS_up020925 [Pythium insidiosum]
MLHRRPSASALASTYRTTQTITNAFDSDNAALADGALESVRVIDPDPKALAVATFPVSSRSTTDEDGITTHEHCSHHKTPRQLRHREAMVRFRRRKRVRVAELERQEAMLQREMEQHIDRRLEALRRPQTGVATGADRLAQLREAVVNAIVETEALIRENDALELLIADHVKFQAVLVREHERERRDGVWKCT